MKKTILLLALILASANIINAQESLSLSLKSFNSNGDYTGGEDLHSIDIWIVTDGGAPSTDDFEGLRNALIKLDKADKKVSLEFPNIEIFPEKAFDTYPEGEFWAGDSNKSLISVKADRAISIEKDAFTCCESLTNISFPKVKSIGVRAFAYCTHLENISFPEAELIEEDAFYQCGSLVNVSFPKVKSVGMNAFACCGRLTSISLPEAKSIGKNAFWEVRFLESVLFPKVENVGSRAFIACDLKSIILPEARIIGDGAFWGLDSLTTVILPKVTTIGSKAFANSKNLNTLEVATNKGTVVKYVARDIFDGVNTSKINLTTGSTNHGTTIDATTWTVPTSQGKHTFKNFKSINK